MLPEHLRVAFPGSHLYKLLDPLFSVLSSGTSAVTDKSCGWPGNAVALQRTGNEGMEENYSNVAKQNAWTRKKQLKSKKGRSVCVIISGNA
jgi:hypothetical protein